MQHVGIHCIDGVKTEIPNIKNLNSRCNGRGRVRRTSYRGTQDSYEKFRRHVESSLGPILAECCILPTKNPDFSNLTLRPLLNDHVPATISEDTPLCESVATPGVVSQNASYKRPRCDSVVDGMDKHFPGGSASSSRSLTSPSSDIFRTMSPPTKKHARLDMINYVNQHQHSGKHLQAHRGSSSSSSFIVAEHDANAERARNGIYSDSYIFPRQIQEHRLSYPVYPALIQPPAHMAEFSHRMHSGSLGGITSSAMPTSNVRSQSGGYKQR
ncbi:hypothetical protein FB639_000816 [Coemansia asiatica]|nr:hypothetical protein FB639_000816 [Coemansia asiatica]